MKIQSLTLWHRHRTRNVERRGRCLASDPHERHLDLGQKITLTLLLVRMLTAGVQLSHCIENVRAQSQLGGNRSVSPVLARQKLLQRPKFRLRKHQCGPCMLSSRVNFPATSQDVNNMTVVSNGRMPKDQRLSAKHTEQFCVRSLGAIWPPLEGERPINSHDGLVDFSSFSHTKDR